MQYHKNLKSKPIKHRSAIGKRRPSALGTLAHLCTRADKEKKIAAGKPPDPEVLTAEAVRLAIEGLTLEPADSGRSDRKKINPSKRRSARVARRTASPRRRRHSRTREPAHNASRTCLLLVRTLPWLKIRTCAPFCLEPPDDVGWKCAMRLRSAHRAQILHQSAVSREVWCPHCI